MAKSKLVKANEKIEKAVVGSYQKIEDKFIDNFLRQDNETIEEAKERLKKESKENIEIGRIIFNMKKETLLEIILGTLGGIIFAIGMCMCLIAEWDLLKLGIILGIIGLLICVLNYPVYAYLKDNKND